MADSHLQQQSKNTADVSVESCAHLLYGVVILVVSQLACFRIRTVLGPGWRAVKFPPVVLEADTNSAVSCAGNVKLFVGVGKLFAVGRTVAVELMLEVALVPLNCQGRSNSTAGTQGWHGVG